MILFGGTRRDGLVFCNSACESKYTISINLPKAHKTYRGALAELRTAPTDPGVKEKALMAGREYASWTREGSGVTVFDEVALTNDIQAACAAASNAGSSPAAPTLTLEQRLERLETLKQRALISSAEYESKRAAILAEL